MLIPVKTYMQRIRSTVGWWYWLGTYGNIPTKSLWGSKSKQRGIEWWYVSWANAYQKAINLYNANKSVRVSDCVGLDKYARWLKTDGSVPYDASTDLNQEMLFAKAKNMGMKHGTIDSLPEVEGVAVYLKGHIGFYTGNGKAIEARGGQYGVVITDVNTRGWTHWFYNPFVDYSEGVNNMVISRTSNNNHPVVKPVQEAIIFLGRADAVIVGGAQGIIGTTTDAAIKGIQKALGQTQDGVITYNFLGGLLNLVRLKNIPGVTKAAYDKVVSDLNNAKAAVNRLNGELVERNGTITALNTALDSYKKDNTTLQKKVDDMLVVNERVSNEIIGYMKEITDKENTILEVAKELNTFKGIAQDQDFEIKRLNEKITDLEELLATEPEVPVPVTVIDWKDAKPGDLLVKAIRLWLGIEEKKDG